MGTCGSKKDADLPQKQSTLSSPKIAQTSQTPRGISSVRVSPDIFISLKEGSLSDFYRIGEVIGEGGFGCVRIATHKQTDNIRAIKQIKKDRILKEDEASMFAEVDVLKSLDHPNIVKLYELYQDTRYYYLITEYLEGGELFDRLQNDKVFTEKKAATYMKQLLSAVAYCHERNIIHRDLKLENLILESRRNDANLKVIDFGTSRKVDPKEKLSRRIGTPYYMAPEVLQKSYDKKCDVWSCGVILYILLCGYPPFNGNDQEIKRRIEIGKYQYDPEEWGNISNEAKSLIDRMLTYQPEKRITVMQALNDPWIVDKAPSTQISNNLLKNLQNFYSTSKWQAAIQMFIVTQIQTNKEKEELQKQFKAMDRNHDGTLSKEEILVVYEKVYNDKEKAKKICEDLFRSADYNGSGSIDFTEFLIASSNQEKMNSKQRLEKVFKIFDRDSNGQISRVELQQIMGGIELDETSWNDILTECDRNNDGQISLQEFIDLMQNQYKT